jgi:uncharacterized integral membrane protein (TIGR00698 family)
MKTPDASRRPWPGHGAAAAAWVHLPGVMVCGVIALAATFIAEHHGGPVLLHALLLGLAFHFLAGVERVAPGVSLCARGALRCGVALLGARITFDQVAGLGLGTAARVAAAVAATIAFGLLLARLMGRPRTEGLVSGCSVGICGASAALAVAAALPPSKDNERFTLLVVVGVTLLSTVAMLLYPLLLGGLQASPRDAGVFLGGTIHDIAQVVAAGLMMGQETGETAAIVKLFRVALLVPVVALVALAFRSGSEAPVGARVPALPGFLLAFVFFVVLASTGVIGSATAAAAGEASRWLLVVAIAAAGIKTAPSDLARLGWQPAAMLVAETVFIAALFLAWTV